MRLLRNLFVIIGVFILLGGCKDEPEGPVLTIAGNEVLISNEGNFGWGDGSLSLYSPSEKSVQNEVFKSKNGVGLGNVFQSISYHNNQYFFVLNNSNKIVVASDSLDQINQITGLTSPRYFYPVTDSKAYFTDLYSNSISIVDLNTLTISSNIKLNGWNEKAVVVNGEFWVTNLDHEFVYIIDIGSDAITDSIKVGFAPESIVNDLQGTIWVLSKGDKATSKLPQLTAINAISKEVIKEIPLAGLPANMVFNTALNQLYFLNNGIFTMAADTASIPELWKESNNNNFYGLGVDINSNDVYVSDIHDFVQKSTIYRFSEEGDLLDEFKTGIIAGNFFFP